MSMTAARGHSPLGMSVLERRVACPGSMRMEEGRPDTPSVYARRGTELHAVAAHCLSRAIDAIDHIPDDADGAAIVQAYLDVVRAAAVAHAPGAMHIEREFQLTALSELYWGTADVVLVAPPKLWVCDLKTGAGHPVPIRRPDGRPNMQLAGYALGVMQSLPRDLGSEITEIELVVMQPRLGPPQSVTLSVGELHDLAADLLDLAEAVVKPDAPLNPGGHCTFCRAAVDCPAARSKALAVAQVEFDIVANPEHAMAPPLPSKLTLDQLSRVLSGARFLETWVAGVEAYAKALADKGVEIPGWKLVNKRGRRIWADEVAAGVVMEDLLGQAAFVTKLHSPTQAEKILKAHKVKPPAEWRDLVVMSDPGTVLAPDHDPRAAVGPRVGFEAVEPEEP